eukprot:353497-Chlamydomonas_euryale.AAC.2
MCGPVSSGAISIGPIPRDPQKFPGRQFRLALTEPGGRRRCVDTSWGSSRDGSRRSPVLCWQVSGARLAECPAASSALPFALRVDG